MKRGSGGLLLACLAIAGCRGAWTEEDRRSFTDDCLTHVRLDDEALRTKICQCWLGHAEKMNSYQELRGQDPQIGAALAEIGKQCATEVGIRAYLPGER